MQLAMAVKGLTGVHIYDLTYENYANFKRVRRWQERVRQVKLLYS